MWKLQNLKTLTTLSVLAITAVSLSAQTTSLTINPTVLTFNATSSAGASTQVLTLTSSGTTSVPYTATTFASGNWLSVNPASGATPQAITVTANPANLATGTYGGFITLSAGGSTINVPVVLNVNVSGPSNVTATPPALTFNFPPGSTVPSTQSVTVGNNGTSINQVTASVTTSTGQPFVTVSPTTLNLTPTSSNQLNVSVNPTGLAAGTYNAIVALTPPGTNGTTVPVVVNVAGPTSLNIAPAGAVNLGYQIGTTAPVGQTLTITTANGTVQPFTASATSTTCGGNWLVVSPTSGATPGSLSVQVNTTSLQAGNCTGQITISAPGTSTPTVNIPVNLLVSTSPLLLVPSTGPTFNFQLGSSTPAAQNVQVTSTTPGVAFTVAATPVTGGANFLNVQPGNGTTPQAVTLSINPTVLATLGPNTYVENVTITSPGSGNTPQTFPVTLVVSSNPILSSSQQSLTFNYQIGQSSPQAQILTLASTGAPLGYSVAAASTNCGNFLSASPTIGQTQVPPGQPGQVVVSVNTTGITTAGTCTGTLTLSVPGSTNAPITIPVTMNVSTTPLINVSPAFVNVTTVAGTSTTVQQNISLTSTDATTPLNFTATAITNPPGLTWLTVAPQTGSTPNVLNVTFNPANLPVGTYMGQIQVSSTSPNIPTQTIPVMFTIASATVTATPTTLTFTQPLNGPAPATQSIQIGGVPSGTTIGATATAFNGTGWLTVTTGASNTLTVTANGANLAQGNYQGLVTVFAPGTTPSPLYIPVSFTVGNPQTIQLASNNVTFTVPQGSTTLPGAQTVNITSTGGNVPFTASFTPVSGGQFLNITPATGNTPGQVSIALNPAVVSTLAPGTYAGAITVGSPNIPGGSQVINVTLTVGAGGSPTISVVNSASNQTGAVAPGEIVALFGANIGPTPAVGLQLNANGTVATTLGNTSVMFDNTPAPLIYAGPNQINVIVPYEVQGKKTTTMTVQRNGVTTATVSLQVVDTAMAIFTLDFSGKGQGAIRNQDNSVNGSATPAAKGSVIQIFATGGGLLTPPGVTGTVTPTTGPTFPGLQFPATVTVGGVPASVTYSGAAPGLVSGAVQINVRIPDNVPSGDQQVVITSNGVSSPANVTVAVQ